MQKFSLKTLILLLIVLILSSCKLTKKIDDIINNIFGKTDDLTEKVLSSLDNAIGELNASQANYQEILQNLINELPSEVQSTVTNEVSNLLTRTVAAAGSEFRCDIDFLRIRVQQCLIRIKAKFLNQSLPPIEPQLCSVVPLAIDMNLEPSRRNKIEFYGYDFDITNIQVFLENNNNKIDVSDKLDVPTHYHMTLNLGSNGVPISQLSKRIILRWNNKDISTIAIIQPNPVICESSTYQFQPTSISYMPPLTRGDEEFAGHGPEIYALVSLKIENKRNLVANVYMRAKETKSDWTTAEGNKKFVLYTANSDKIIESIIGPNFASYSYIDNNHNMDEFPGSGPIRRFRFMGDGKGNDVGYHTRVEIDFNNIKLQLKDANDCISTYMLKSLQIQKPEAMSTSLKNIMRRHNILIPNVHN